MSKQIGSIEIKYSKNGIMLKDGKNMLVIPMDNLAIEATERLESMWFKPPHVISLVREIANMAN